MWAVDTFVPRLADRVREVGQSWRPNVAQAEYHVMAQYLGTELGPEVARVLTEEEPGTTMAEAVRRDSHGLARPLLRADAAAWRRFESAILREVDAVVAYTESDRRALQSLAPEARVVRIPLGVRVPPEPLSAAGTEPQSLVFVGNFMHPPNVDAAKRLLDGILPLVLARRPEARLYLVGDRVPDFLRRAKVPNVIVTGLVDDVTPYLDRAAVVVAPLRRGGGQRVKVMEALAAGKAVVASRLAVDGLDVADEEHVVLAETDDEFANAVLRLLDDEQRRSALGSQARLWAQAHLGVHHTVEGYEQLYAELLRERKRRSCR
jgi:glycosyltransferase involved in cell wall biosynthesis